jgi:S1-C subfamily serine protease
MLQHSPEYEPAIIEMAKSANFTAYRLTRPTLLLLLSLIYCLLFNASGHAQSLSGLHIGDEISRATMIGLPPTAVNKTGPFTIARWDFQDGNSLSVTASNAGRIVYMESDWGQRKVGSTSDFPGLVFGRTTLAQLRAKFASNGFMFNDRGSSFTTSDGIILLNSYEVGPTVVTFYTKVSRDSIVAARDAQKLPGLAVLDGISLADKEYADNAWGERVYDPRYKRIEWPTKPEITSDSHASKTGTGFVINEDGDVVTNAHVVDACAAISTSFEQGSSSTAKVAAIDKVNDLAVLRTGHKTARTAAIKSSDQVRLGEPVAAFGFPLAQVLSRNGNFTVGNVTALAGLRDDNRYLQVSAPVQQGNSGGPLLDQAGNVIGVVSAKLDVLTIAKATQGDIAQNVNFAIKSSLVQEIANSNRIKYSSHISDKPLQSADLADLAQAISVFVLCKN